MSWKRNSILISSAVLALSACGHKPPKVDVDLWAGSPTEIGIRRNAQQLLACEDSRFKDFVCLSFSDLRKLYDVVQQCEQWAPEVAMMTDQDMKFWQKQYAFFQKLRKKVR